MAILCHSDPPFIVDRLYYEAKSWADGVDILAHDPLDDGCFARIVQAAGQISSVSLSRSSNEWMRSYSISILSSLSFSLAFLRIDSIVGRLGRRISASA